MEIGLATKEDARQILSLQRLAYQKEAALYNDFTLPPLTQTLEEIEREFPEKTFFKAGDTQTLIGSVRAHSANDTCFIGRLVVHPDWQRKGIGTRLMNAIEAHFPWVKRFELFTGARSEGNIRLYQNLGYSPFKEQKVHKFLSLVYMEKIVSLPPFRG